MPARAIGIDKLAPRQGSDGVGEVRRFRQWRQINLVDMIEDSIGGRVYVLPEPEHSDYVTTRRDTLEVIQRVSKALNAAEPGALEGWHIRFKMGEHDLEFPFWYSINGPIADAMYHLGQVVALRRAAGLPIPDGVNPFMGTRAEPPA